jgi:hypothetical protein
MGICRRVTEIAAIFGLAVCAVASGQTFSHVVSFQGRLCATDGKPLPDGVYSVQFLIYDEPINGSAIWNDTQEVTQQGGAFSAYLGEEPAFPPDLFTHDRWLAMRVGEEPEMTPRIRLCPAPFAINADMLDGLDSTQFMTLSPPVNLTGEIAHPDAVLTAENTGTGAGLKGISPSWGVLGISTKGTGVYGEGWDSSCKGVEGFTSLGIGVYGYSESTGTGVEGQSDGGIGVHAHSDDSYGFVAESGFGDAAVVAQHLSSGNFGQLATRIYGVYGSGSTAGGCFLSNNATSYAYVGLVNTGISACGNSAGGYFASGTGDGYAQAGLHNTGIFGTGSEAGGYFQNRATDSRAYVAYGDLGIQASGSEAGGRFYDRNGSGEAYVGYGDYGIWASGPLAGGAFEDPGGQSIAYVAKGDVGIRAEAAGVGGYFLSNDDGVESIGFHAGGYFKDGDGTSVAYAATGEYGLWATGALAGGHFQHDSGNASANVATEWMGTYRGIEAFGTYAGGDFGCIGGTAEAYVGYGDLGIAAAGQGAGGYFSDTDGSYAYVAYGSYKIQGTGSVSFVQNHPEEPDKVIVYACPEGDEVATYTRGTARLVDGKVVVPLGETFKWVTNPDIGLTAHLTPRGKAVPLAVVSLTTTELVVCGPEDGPQDLAFDYIVYGLRIGFEEASIVQEKEQEAYIPSMANHRALYDRRPELRQYNAFERFARMRAAAGESGALDLTHSRALHDAIIEFDPATHGVAGPVVHREW